MDWKTKYKKASFWVLFFSTFVNVFVVFLSLFLVTYFISFWKYKNYFWKYFFWELNVLLNVFFLFFWNCIFPIFFENKKIGSLICGIFLIDKKNSLKITRKKFFKREVYLSFPWILVFLLTGILLDPETAKSFFFVNKQNFKDVYQNSWQIIRVNFVSILNFFLSVYSLILLLSEARKKSILERLTSSVFVREKNFLLPKKIILKKTKIGLQKKQKNKNERD